MKKLKKIEVIEQPKQLFENYLSFDALMQNDLEQILGGLAAACNCKGGGTWCQTSYKVS